MVNRYDYTRFGTRFDPGLESPRGYYDRPLTRRFETETGYYDRPPTRRFETETGYYDRPLTRPIDYDYDPYDLPLGTEPTYVQYETWWWVPGPFTGLGPEGYQRSDDRILEDINDRLLQHGHIDAHDIKVDVKDGEVFLKGTVPDRHSKRLAEDVVESVVGVTDVHNDLRFLNKTGQGKTMHGPVPRRDQLRPGMTVLGYEGDKVGKIKEVRDNDFLLDRITGPSILVPFNAVHLMDGEVMLNITSDKIDIQNWLIPEKVGAGRK